MYPLAMAERDFSLPPSYPSCHVDDLGVVPDQPFEAVC